MLHFEWNSDKDQDLKFARGVSFDDVVAAIEAGRILDEIAHPNIVRYPSQRIYYVQIRGYVYVVPYVRRGDVIFLKTVIPSRKATNRYLRGSR